MQQRFLFLGFIITAFLLSGFAIFLLMDREKNTTSLPSPTPPKDTKYTPKKENKTPSPQHLPSPPINPPSITPPPTLTPTPPLSPPPHTQCATQFLHALLSHDISKAQALCSPKDITYPQLATLCILFEETQLEAGSSPLTHIFERPTKAGWIANLHLKNQQKNVQLALSAHLLDGSWRIVEVNFDSLLEHYAQEQGDVIYTPLIHDPHAGDTLVIYFDLDSSTLTPRSKRQLSIVSKMLKKNPSKKLHIYGHTDDLGSDPYNLKLSVKRAQAVRLFFEEAGLTSQQMEVIGFGKTRPRALQRNDPQARRSNRRAEIYLDF